MTPEAPPQPPDATMARALEVHGIGDLEQAAELYALALEADPKHFLALHNLGILRAGEGRTQEAIELIGRAVEVDPTSAEASGNLGALLAGAGRTDEAEAAFNRALAVQPDFAAAQAGLADIAVGRGQREAGREHYEQALAADPNHTQALTGLGVLLMEQGLAREAGERFALALALQPGSGPAHYNVANALKVLGRLDEAKVYFRQALELAPDFADAWTNLGNVYRDDGELAEALICHRHATELKPASATVHLNLGQLLRDRGDAEAARAEFQRALELDPDDPTAALCLCMAELPLIARDEADVAACRARYAARLGALIASYDSGPRPEAWAQAVGASQPFYLAYQAENDRDLQALYGAFVCRVMRDWRPEPPPLPPPRAAGERIRVGVVSGFFSAHSNWKIPIKGWIGQLDRSRFEVIGYHTGARQDACTDEARRLCDRFVQGPMTTDAWRARIGEDAPHALIYPEVGIDPASARLAAQRLAPLQCASWGHPDTTGFPTIDAFLSSDGMEPEGGEAHYSERLVRLPGLGVWLEPVEESPAPLDRAALGYRPGAVVFWCAQSLPKYLPRYDDVFPRIARRVGDCQFVFIGLAQTSEAEEIFTGRLRDAFARHELSAADHVVMLPRLSKAAFIGAKAQADVVLDSLGWSGCNSILEGLDNGLPVVTHRGEHMRGRHGAAILEIAGVTETIARTVDEYVDLAAGLALGPSRRRRIGAAIAAGQARLYRDDRSVRALEAFIEQALAERAG